MKKILVTDCYTTESLAYLRSQVPHSVVLSQKLQPTLEELHNAEGLLIRSRTRIDHQLLSQADDLKIIITATSGFDHIDLNLCQQKKITVMFTPDAQVPSVCELTFALLLNLFRRLTEMKEHLRKGHWKDQLPWGRELCGLNLGIIGLGRIGSRVAQVAQTFGMKVAAYDPYQSEEAFAQLQVERLGLSEIFMSADVLSLHVPLTHDTRHLINHQTLSIINPEAVIVNTSRGAIINEMAVIEALENKTLSGLALDVFEKEPLPPTSRLLSLPQVVLSCHVGAFTTESLQRASMDAVHKMVNWIKSDGLQDVLPPQAAWYQSDGYHES